VSRYFSLPTGREIPPSVRGCSVVCWGIFFVNSGFLYSASQHQKEGKNDMLAGVDPLPDPGHSPHSPWSWFFASFFEDGFFPFLQSFHNFSVFDVGKNICDSKSLLISLSGKSCQQK
jgi:hypothetical protein